MPSMLMAILQGLVSSAFAYAAACGFMVAYALLRHHSWEMAWFTAVAFLLMSLYVTQVGGVCFVLAGRDDVRVGSGDCAAANVSLREREKAPERSCPPASPPPAAHALLLLH